MIDRKDGRWRIIPEVSLGDVVALVVALTAVLAAYGKLDTRVSVVEITTAANTIAVRETSTEIKGALVRLNDKMDRLTERLK